MRKWVIISILLLTGCAPIIPVTDAGKLLVDQAKIQGRLEKQIQALDMERAKYQLLYFETQKRLNDVWMTGRFSPGAFQELGYQFQPKEAPEGSNVK